MRNDYYWRLAQRSAELAGIPAEWIYSQWVHETGNFTSELCLNYNNLGGITQLEKNNLPQPDGNYFYMEFSTAEDYADYFGYYLTLYREDGIYEATDILSYAEALKSGGYFGDSVENYVAGMIAAHNEADF